MNEEALQLSYQSAQEGGYKGSVEDYKNLLSTNKEALSLAYSDASSKGYNKSIEDFSSLLGVKQITKPPTDPKGVKPEVSGGSNFTSGDGVSLSGERKNLPKVDFKSLPNISDLLSDKSTPKMKEASQKLEEIKRVWDNPELLPDADPRGLLENISTQEKEELKNKAGKDLQKYYKGLGVKEFNIDDKMITRKAVELLKQQEQQKLYEDTNMWEQADLKFQHGGLRTLSGLAGIGNFLNKTFFTLTADDETLEFVNSLTPEQREAYINTVFNQPLAGVNMGLMGKMSAQAQNYLKNKADIIDEEIVKFDNSINDDFANGDWGKGVSRLLTEGAAQVPMLAQTMVPIVGLPSLVASEAATKQEELEDEGFGLGLDTSLNATINGGVIGLSEALTKRLGGKIFRAFNQADEVGKQSIINSLKNSLSAGAQEGFAEVGEGLVTRLSDSLIQGKEGMFENYWDEAMDEFLMGKAFGTTLGATAETIRETKTLVEDFKTNRILNKKSNEFTDLSSVYLPSDKKMSLDKLRITSYGSTGIRLDHQLDQKVKRGEITEEQAGVVKQDYNNSVQAYNKTRGTKMYDSDRKRAVNLIQEKESLQKEIKNMDDALATQKKNRVEVINKQLEELSAKKPEPKKTDQPIEEVKEAVQEKKSEVLSDKTTKQKYSERLSKAKKEGGDNYWAVDEINPKEEGVVVENDWGGAFVTKDGDIKGVFRDPNYKGESKITEVIKEAVDKGGVKLDVFSFKDKDKNLVEKYKKEGFRPVATTPFDATQVKGYDKIKHGEVENVTAMIYDPKGEMDITVKEFTDYNQTLAYRDQYLMKGAKKTQNFFSDVVSGKKDKYKPSKPYEYEQTFNIKQESFKQKYDQKKGEFDEHIATSIPTFRDNQVKKGVAIVESLPEGGLIYDIGGSEGGFVKTITEESGGKIRSINLDPNPDMKKAYDKSPVKGAEVVTEAFQEGFDDVPAHKPKEKADVVHESMVFQFIDKERTSKIKEVKDNYLKDDGLFITEEKFKLDDASEYKANEDLKNKQHKSKYYTETQLKAKGEDVLVGMDKNQANYNEYIKELQKEFKYVTPYWKSGNFRGIVATNNKGKHDAFLSNLGDNINQYSVDSGKLQQEEKQIEDSYNKSKTTAKKSRDRASGKIDPYKSKLRKKIDKITDVVLDRQGSVKRAFRKMGVERVIDFMVSSAGASSNAKNKAEIAYNKIFRGLSNTNLENLEEIINLRRNIAIDENRASRNLEPIKHSGGFTTEESKQALEGYKNNLGEKLYKDLNKRADEYFNEFKSLLKNMKDEGIINQSSYEALSEIDYSPRKFLSFLEDIDNNLMQEKLDKDTNNPLSKAQIQSLGKGSEGEVLMDMRYLLEKAILTRSRAIAANKLNNVFVEEFNKTKKEVEALRKKKNLTLKEKKKIKNFELVENQVVEDNIVGFTKKGKPKYKYEDKNTRGYSSLYYYKDGVKNRILMKSDFFDKFTDTNNQWINSNQKENIAMASGTALVKTIATGNNPLFFITNTPRDFVFALTFSKEYGNEVVSNSIKLAKDFVKGVSSVVNNKQDYQKALEHGLGMDYLAVQGKYRDKGWGKALVDNVISQKNQDRFTRNRVKKFMDKFNLASEVGIRMAVFNRSIKNQLKDLGTDNIESLDKKTQDNIYARAVRSARELTDFNQGGKLTKALDAGVPYLNAAVQGTRVAANAFNERPLETTIRTIQITAYTSAATMVTALSAISFFRDEEETKGMSNADIYFETIKGVSEYDLTNYMIIPLGYKDNKGDWRYLRVAKSQAISPLVNTTEHFLRKSLAESSGSDYEGDINDILSQTVGSNILPDVNPLRTPIVNAAVKWSTGIDPYTGNPLDWKRGEIPEELEGITSDRIDPMFQTLGKKFGISPARLQKSLEAFITTPDTNPYIGIAYALGNTTIGDKTFSEEREGAFKELTRKATRRFLKSTSEYNETAKLEKRFSKEGLEIYREHLLLEKKVKNAVRKFKEKGNKNKLITLLREEIKEDPKDAEKVLRWAESELKKNKVPSIITTIKFQKNKEVRALMIAKRFGKALINIKDLDPREKEMVNLMLKENVLDSQTLNYYKSLFKK